MAQNFDLIAVCNIELQKAKDCKESYLKEVEDFFMEKHFFDYFPRTQKSLSELSKFLQNPEIPGNLRANSISEKKIAEIMLEAKKIAPQHCFLPHFDTNGNILQPAITEVDGVQRYIYQHDKGVFHCPENFYNAIYEYTDNLIIGLFERQGIILTNDTSDEL